MPSHLCANPDHNVPLVLVECALQRWERIHVIVGQVTPVLPERLHDLLYIAPVGGYNENAERYPHRVFAFADGTTDVL